MKDYNYYENNISTHVLVNVRPKYGVLKFMSYGLLSKMKNGSLKRLYGVHLKRNHQNKQFENIKMGFKAILNILRVVFSNKPKGLYTITIS